MLKYVLIALVAFAAWPADARPFSGHQRMMNNVHARQAARVAVRAENSSNRAKAANQDAADAAYRARCDLLLLQGRRC